ncbi:hypothetical protein COK81_19995 [Bacillus thuringiensis]|uniref:DNA alkylation repair protein n=1 Tax=Bacillus thuringiensis TaxID=1428 RepID=A0A9X7AXY3_BACTU|nr:hypothetical protein [Bacillus thuringiensis]PFT87587.1 hypothetical protein COK81_19995 [Bacillus thuringiensis]
MVTVLKDVYNKEFILHLGNNIHQLYEDFNVDSFQDSIFVTDWTNKGLKERMRHITTCLYTFLPSDYQKSITILQAIAPKFSNQPLAAIIFSDFVAVYGLEHWQISLSALECLTQYSTSEYAVRPFIQRAPDQMVQQMLQWSMHPNHHVRRLSSKGIRPRLPWAIALQRFKFDPYPIIPILDNLKEDTSLYVRKSVANNLNDISKDHPTLVLDLTEKWIGNHIYTDWILKHACRSLLKKGDTRALSLFGFSGTSNVQVTNLKLDKNTIFIGGKLFFSLQITGALDPSLLRIEYAIHFMKARGERSQKIFKVAESILYPEKNLSYHKSHSFKDLTTRKHYEGTHTLSILINGEVKASTEFYLKMN